jgi:hypothetical protein
MSLRMRCLATLLTLFVFPAMMGVMPTMADDVVRTFSLLMFVFGGEPKASSSLKGFPG